MSETRPCRTFLFAVAFFSFCAASAFTIALAPGKPSVDLHLLILLIFGLAIAAATAVVAYIAPASAATRLARVPLASVAVAILLALL